LLNYDYLLALIPVVIIVSIWRSIRSQQTQNQIGAKGNQRSSGDDNEDRPSPDFAALIDAMKAEGRANRAEEKREDRSKVLREWLTILLIALTFGAIVKQVVEMVKVYEPIKTQGEAMQRSAKAAENSLAQAETNFRDTQRPYVWLSDNGMPSIREMPQNGTARILWSWHYTNYGRSPALHLRAKQEIKLGNGPFVPSFDNMGNDPISLLGRGPSLPPNKQDFLTAVSPQIEAGEAVRLQHTEEGITIRMVIVYTDSYGGDYRTDICLYLLATSAISYCQEGNNMK
jgi:hypothetical protein